MTIDSNLLIYRLSESIEKPVGDTNNDPILLLSVYGSSLGKQRLATNSLSMTTGQSKLLKKHVDAAQSSKHSNIFEPERNIRKLIRSGNNFQYAGEQERIQNTDNFLVILAL